MECIICEATGATTSGLCSYCLEHHDNSHELAVIGASSTGIDKETEDLLDSVTKDYN